MKFLACSMLLIASASGDGLRLGRMLAEEDGPEWTYRSQGTAGEEPYGPDDWHLGYPDCGLSRQSPINLAADLSMVASPADFNLEFTQNFCDSSELVFTSNFAVYEVAYDGCSTDPHLMFQGEKYNLLQLHIHSPSEYQVGGAEHAAGIHMVHAKESTGTDLLVVGIMYDVDDYGDNLEIEKLWSVLRTGQNTTEEAFTSQAYDLLPVSPSYSHYMGSLTTPPCTQGVTWIVMNEPSKMGRKQLDEYRDSVASYPGSKVSEFGNTNRPVQPLNNRPLTYVTP